MNDASHGSRQDAPFAIEPAHSLGARIRRAAFALTMFVVLCIGLASLLFALWEIPHIEEDLHGTSLRIIGERMQGDIQHRIRNIEQLSQSSMIWTALTDSSDRELYLRPYLAGRLRDAVDQGLQLLDYKGRPVAGELEAQLPEQELQQLIGQVLTSEQGQSQVLGSNRWLVSAHPVLFPMTQDVIGVFVGVYDLEKLLILNGAGLDQDHSLRLRYRGVQILQIPTWVEHHYFPVSHDIHLPGSDERLQLELSSNNFDWISPVLAQLLLYLAVGLALALLVWWLADRQSRELTRRLDQLVGVCRQEHMPQPEPVAKGTGDEIDLLTHTLYQAIDSRDQVLGHLEDLVAIRTGELEESRERYYQAFEINSAIKLIIDPSDGRIIDANEAACNFYGYSRRRLLSLRISDINTMPPQQIQVEMELAAAQHRLYFNFNHRLSSGEIRQVEVYSGPITIKGCPYLHSIIHDVTQRRRTESALRESELRFRTYVEHSPIAVVVIDQQGEYLDANPAAELLTGVRREALLGSNILALSPPEERHKVRQGLARLSETGHLEGDFRRLHPDGSSRWFSVRAVRLEQQRYLLFVQDITQRKQNEQALLESKLRFETLFESIGDAVFVHEIREDGLPGRFIECNQSACRQTGYSRGELLAMSPLELDAGDSGIDLAPVLAAIDSGDLAVFEQVHIDRQGRRIPVEIHARRFLLDGRLLIISIVRDITERKQAETRLRLAASVFEHSQEGVMLTDQTGRILEVNRAFSRITGYPREEVIGQNPRILKSDRQDAAFYQEMWQSLNRTGYWQGEVWNRRRDGSVYPELLSISAVKDGQEVATHYAGVFTDISEIKLHEQQLERIAHYDALTQLPNRLLLTDRLGVILARARRTSRLVGVCYLDLDGFKAVNDTLGHAGGDRLLVEIARRLTEVVRDSDTVARLGGDEFVLILADLESLDVCDDVMQRVIDTVAGPVTVDDVEVQVSASVGIVLYPETDGDADTLLRYADQAMYEAKSAGKNRYYMFNPEQDRRAHHHRQLIHELERALRKHELLLYFQPKVNLRTGQVVGVEALLRWQHPQRGLLFPAEFLLGLNNAEMETLIDRWVLRTALKQLDRWHAAGLELPVSVNVSAPYLEMKDFVPYMGHLMLKHPGARGLLELEILETAALDDIEQVTRVMSECRDLGISFALDDFGTGYSSLTYLRRLPVQTLKIDNSFVIDMLDDPEDRGIVEGIIGLGQAFGRGIVAEGVETLAHGSALLRMGCEIAQGFGISAALPAQEIPGWVASWHPHSAWVQCCREGHLSVEGE